ncbi:60S ribosomal protein L27 (nucleomorph) [Chroomonas mesostigmatica CCMP1168]|uniref:60S ribosomal protein L27 n=1 Tax=Chroomonas mesostigmatica CCMP1168 TaxID=1195612 RepID=J7G5G2_9CRYP|nr:60S ribosomal protein L27 [Chroomonas mesostigmatica CCMP1168]|mmetsp:Transcript_60048/g.147653  ORF Transcript_60048/g.147653 Transcript_60048/m.147653 type:complete len:156 (+) Transcript_60048:744-1211(+)
MAIPTDQLFGFARLVLVLNGKYAGRKGFTIGYKSDSKKKTWDKVLVVGIKKNPFSSKKKKFQIDKNLKKNTIKVFVKKYNSNHIFPTRYFIGLTEDIEDSIEKKLKDAIAVLLNSSIEGEEEEEKKKEITLFFRNFLRNVQATIPDVWFLKKLKF